MRQRLLTFALVVGCAALFAVSAILTMAEDKKAPVITIEDKDKEITYRDGDDYAELLDGVTAKDNRDGDVTDQIFVDSITAVSDGTRAIVRYAVIDKSNNVGIKTRVIDLKAREKADRMQVRQQTTRTAIQTSLRQRARSRNKRKQKRKIPLLILRIQKIRKKILQRIKRTRRIPMKVSLSQTVSTRRSV